MAAIEQLAAESPEDTRWRKILAVERIADEDQAFVLALVENLHREDLSAQDEADAIERRPGLRHHSDSRSGQNSG